MIRADRLTNRGEQLMGLTKLFNSNALRSFVAIPLLLAGLGSLTGCQVDIGGQTLPSPWYLDDDVQYFAPGTEFPLANEAAALDEYSKNQ